MDSGKVVRETWEMKCPSCGADDGIEITALTTIRLTPEGDEDIGDHEWDHNSSCFCNACDYSGVVSDFKIENQEAA